MEILLLGPVQARIADRAVKPGVRKQRLLLAVLALEVNRPVDTRRLVDLVWPLERPATAVGMIHTYVSGLRKLLNNLGCHEAGIWLEREDPGYLLRCDPHRVDAHRFRSLVADSRAGPDGEARATLLAQALALWRGPALSGATDDDVRARLCAGLEEARLTALEDLCELRQRLGRHHGLLEELLGLTEENPLRPRLTGALMRELHRAGRTAEALAVFRRARERLKEELGLDPPALLQDVHLALLRAVPPARVAPAQAVLPAASPTRAMPAQAVPLPRELPMDLPTFTGRAAELDALTATADAATVDVTVIDGMAGIGKTALAVHAAHALASRYADGQLFVELHGFTTGVHPVEPADALDQMLRSLGVPGAQIPPGLDARAALYRTHLSGKHALIVLDNAAGEDQVWPLLPAAAGCRMLITSRKRLVGLDDVRSMSLEVLPPADAQALFLRIAGPDHPPAIVQEIIEWCGWLPLGIRVAAARLRARPSWTAAHLVERLRDQQHRLAELRIGNRSVTAAIDLSYQHVPATQQRLYRLLGVHPGPDIDTYAAAALAGVYPRRAARALEDLADTNLLHEFAPGRYRFHDLVRAHAASRRLPEPDRHAALTRLFDHYSRTASVAMDVVYPYSAGLRPRSPRPGAATPDFPDREAAARWLDEELPNLLATAHSGRPAYAIHMSASLQSHLLARGRYADAESLHTTALESARKAGDPVHEVQTLNRVGRIQNLQGRYDPAAACYERVLPLARELGAGDEESEALWGLGYGHYMQGRNVPAIGCYRQALRSARESGDRVRELTALQGLGHVYYTTNRCAVAASQFTVALRLARQIGHRVVEFDVLRGLGNIHRTLCRHHEALDLFEQALEIAREIGHRHGELALLRSLAGVRLAQGEHRAAARCYEESLDMARAIGDRNSQFEAVLGLGHAHQAAGRSNQALACHKIALGLASELGQLDDQARAHNGLALAHSALCEFGRARGHWQRALTILTDLSIPSVEELELEEIRANLAGPSPHCHDEGTGAVP